MSLKTFFTKLWASIKSIFAKLKPHIKDAVHYGVVIAEAFQQYEDGPLGDFISSILKGQALEVQEVIKAKLPEILIKMRLVDASLQGGTPEEVVAAAVEVFKSIDPNYKPGFLNELAVQITMVVSDGEITWDEGQTLIKWYYDHQYVNPETLPSIP